MEDPIASINRVYGIVLREERHASITKVKEEKIEAAMAVRSHDNCYDKHGYEVVKARERGRGRRGGSSNRGANNRGRGRGRRHQANAVGNSSGTRNAETSNQNIPFTIEEIEKLRTLLQGSPNGNGKLQGMKVTLDIKWLIDSGCSHHMTGKRDLLKNIRHEEQFNVSLPDGRIIKAEIHGEVELSKDFVLKDVLFVPTLACDLISVQQLISENNCIVTFYNDYCEMQDQTMRMKIGQDKTQDKFGERGKRYIFLGYPHSKKGWKVYDLKERRVFVSRDVILYEHVFPYLVSENGANTQQGGAQTVSQNQQDTDLYTDDFEIEEPYVVRGIFDDSGVTEDVNGEHADDTSQGIGVVPNTSAGTFDSPGNNEYDERTEQEMEQDATNTRAMEENMGRGFLVKIDKHKEPTYYYEAAKSLEWREAMRKEIDVLEENGTWKIVSLPEGWSIEQLDVNNAFLHGDLDEEVYMKIPQVAMKSYGFVKSLADYSLFTLNQNVVFIGVLIYVDDMIVVSNGKKACEKFKAFLDAQFGIKDLGKLKFFLGIEVDQRAGGLFLNQRKYAMSIIEESGMAGAKTAYTPI
ncbi:uncharacterized protein LOC141587974 [Silene latifolia]|uniref:uncharacterized protein LOC141587974 n=1 Tax=Silene latifolia TaxID=37657 RepID=UPI003D78B2B9